MVRVDFVTLCDTTFSHKRERTNDNHHVIENQRQKGDGKDDNCLCSANSSECCDGEASDHQEQRGNDTSCLGMPPPLVLAVYDCHKNRQATRREISIHSLE